MTLNASIVVAARTLEKMEISHIAKRDVGQGCFASDVADSCVSARDLGKLFLFTKPRPET